VGGETLTMAECRTSIPTYATGNGGRVFTGNIQYGQYNTKNTTHLVDGEPVGFRTASAHKTNSPREQQTHLLNTFLFVRNPEHRLQEIPGTRTHSVEIKIPTRIFLGLLK
jgi:hypothetical protein